MTGVRSSLSGLAPLCREVQPGQARAAAKAAWKQNGLILINPEWLGEWDRQQATLLAEKLHGKRDG